MKGENREILAQVKQLIFRLERISADSIWAHRSSGHRGALLRWVDILESHPGKSPGDGWLDEQDLENLHVILRSGYVLLERAAREVIK